VVALSWQDPEEKRKSLNHYLLQNYGMVGLEKEHKMVGK
jgi:hypothetical protein